MPAQAVPSREKLWLRLRRSCAVVSWSAGGAGIRQRGHGLLQTVQSHLRWRRCLRDGTEDGMGSWSSRTADGKALYAAVGANDAAEAARLLAEGAPVNWKNYLWVRSSVRSSCCRQPASTCCQLGELNCVLTGVDCECRAADKQDGAPQRSNCWAPGAGSAAVGPRGRYRGQAGRQVTA